VVRGIDEVRAHLEGLDGEPAGGERCHQAACKRGLAAAALGSGDNYSWDRAHNVPVVLNTTEDKYHLG
jgi:hypothetical protein